MARPRKIRANGADRREADRHNRQAILDYIENASDRALADAILFNLDLFEDINSVMDWDVARDAITDGNKDARKVLHEIIGGATPPQIDALKIKDPKFQHRTPEDFARERIAKQAKFENQYGHSGAILARGTGHLAQSVGSLAKLNIGDGLYHLSAGSLDLLHGGRLEAQKYLGIRPIMGAIMGTLSVADAGLATAAYANAPFQTTYSNAHMMNAFQQACLNNDSVMGAAFDVAFSPDMNSSNSALAYNAMKIAQMYDLPELTGYIISYLESNRFRDLVANNSSATGYMQFIDSTALGYLHDMGKKTFTYKDAKESIESGIGSQIDLARKRAIVIAIDAIAATDKETLKQMADSKKIPDAIFEGLSLADGSIMQVELVMLDMIAKTDIEHARTPEQVMAETVGYYQEHHFLGSGNYNVLEMLATRFPSTSITAAQDVLGFKAGQNMISVVAGNPGLLENGMTAPEALESIKNNFREIVGPAYEKFLANYDPSKSVAETCLGDFTATAQADIKVISRGEYTVKLFNQAFTALTPAFVGINSDEGKESFAPTTTLTVKKTAEAPMPFSRPENIL